MVVDASVLANVLADDGPDGDLARSVLSGSGGVGTPGLSMPDLADVATAAVLRKRWMDRTITASRFADAISDLTVLPILRYPASPLLSRAYELRATTTVYDAVYVALAETLECALITADAKLAKPPGTRCSIRVLRHS